MAAKKDLEAAETQETRRLPHRLPTLPKALTLEEKKYLLAVERGDSANVRRCLQKAHRNKHIDINCVDALGRGALTLAIEGENLEMVELLVVMGVETRDALLQAIHAEFVEAVELLLEHEELIYKYPQPYSWQKVDTTTSMFTPDITPLILAAHKNNYEIIKLLLDRGATLPDPHDIRCGCEECIKESAEDSLRHSMARLNAYRALASPSLIALSATDPILTAFQLSWELRNLAFSEPESKAEYLQLRRKTQQFAVDLLHQSRSTRELAVLLNHDPDDEPFEDGEQMKLARLKLAINFKQKKFVAHPNIQQLLAALWYDGVPGFRRKSAFEKLMIICRVALLFPLYCILYMVAPSCSTGKLMRKPFMKFLIHASSYLFFLLILILVSQRAEVQIMQMFGSETQEKVQEVQRGHGPTYLELLILVYVLGFIWQETHEMYVEGMRSYLRNMWNFIDFTRNSLYLAVGMLRFVAYLEQAAEIRRDPQTRFIPREQWDEFDPQLISEGLFAAANIFSALKLVHLFSINPHLGPLQISLGRMVIDIVKFFFIYSLVLFAFACGLNQLLWYFADLEKRKCYVLPGGLPDWDHAGDSCMKWRSFGNVFEASQSLFWASFGMVGLENFELAGIKSYTRFWGLLMFGSYSVINVIVLLNLLIAMMSNSYAMIDEHSDVEWKFARTKLWLSYFEETSTLPPPFNIIPTPKLVMTMFGMRKKTTSKKIQDQKERENDERYTAVIRALVWRYVSSMHRKMDDEPVTEDDINELKGNVSALRYELLHVFERNGMDVSFTDKKEKTHLAKRMKTWERCLMKDFQVTPVSVLEDDGKPVHEDSLARFRRIAKMVAANASGSKWDQTLAAAGISSQIGRCRTRESFKNRKNLQHAMEQARRLVLHSPVAEGSRVPSPVQMPATPGRSLQELIRDMSQDVGAAVDVRPASPYNPAADNLSVPVVRLLSPSTVFGGAASPQPSVKIEAKSQSRARSPSPTQGRPQARPESPACSVVSNQTEPSPLKAARVGVSPPRVVKKKQPSGDTHTVENEKPDVKSVARPSVPDIKPTGCIPPPPSNSKTKAPCTPTMELTPSATMSKAPCAPTMDVTPSTPVPKAPCAPTMEVTPCTPVLKPPRKLAARSRSPSPKQRSFSPKPQASKKPPLTSTSSTEYLIPTSPACDRSGQKIEDVRTIKRQPRTGWL